MKNRLLQYYIQTLSPVHVGSGVRWRNGLDFFPAAGCTWLRTQTAARCQSRSHARAARQ